MKTDVLLHRIAPLGDITCRSMFGGQGLYWNGTIFVPPSPSPRVCHFEINGETVLGSTRIVFVHR